MLGIIFISLQQILEIMNINFNTTLFAIYGICFGANYWNSNMYDDFGETDLTGETEHCLQFFIAVLGISFVWFTQDEA